MDPEKLEYKNFTDGSGLNDNIGAAAILRRRGQADKTLRFQLGSSSHYTVYNGEQIGMLLGAELLRREPNVRSVYMGVDNQAAITATVSRNCLLQTLESALRKHNLQSLSVRWVPGHANVAGNEAVDVEAKKAAEGETSSTDLLPAALKRRDSPACLPYNKSALIQDHNAFVASQVKSSFSNSHRGKRMHKIDPSLPSAKFSLLVQCIAAPSPSPVATGKSVLTFCSCTEHPCTPPMSRTHEEFLNPKYDGGSLQKRSEGPQCQRVSG